MTSEEAFLLRVYLMGVRRPSWGLDACARSVITDDRRVLEVWSKHMAKFQEKEDAAKKKQEVKPVEEAKPVQKRTRRRRTASPSLSA